MRNKATARLREKQQIDPGYAIVTRINNLWNSKTMEFNSYLCGEPVMPTAKLERLVQALKLMHSEVAAGLKELEARLD
jgi:hypothetical protein